MPVEFNELLRPTGNATTATIPSTASYAQFAVHQERANATLPGTDTKLSFLLTYLKNNSLQQYQAASFSISQTRVSRLAGVLLNVLNQTLGARHLLPVRDSAQLAQRLATHPDKVFTYDGVERGIPRNANWDGQQEEYSAKKSPCLKKQHVM